MSKEYDFMVEQARQKPDSTTAIALRSIRDEEMRRSNERRAAVKGFFARIFGKGR